ncbi:MAG: DEAD/DEAH box helicase, partial [Bacteroidales bacterium]|nr:DEAD/DEAH box helicase [Bacteroidales bacterium]
MDGLDMEIQFLPGVGPKRAALLSKELGASTVGDLLRFYPFRYIDKSSIVRIADARPDMAYLQIRAKVLRVELYGAGSATVDAPSAGDSSKEKTVKFNTIRRMSVWIGDGSGEMETVFFKGIKWMYEKLQPGAEFIFFGKPTAFNGRINIVHPEVDNCPVGGSGQNIGAGQQASRGIDASASGSMTGVYTSTEKLKNSGITGKIMTKIMSAAIEKGLPCMQETLPDYIMKQAGLVPLHFAIRNIHFPKDMVSLEKAKYRLKFEELFFLQLSLLKQKYVRSRSEQGIQMPRVGDAFNQCYESLPFPLTGAQKRVITEIRNDMKSGHQMNRLLQGDVGSGKTMVAVLTALIAIGNGYQACIMAPTEVLAQQHFKNIQ